MIDVPHVEKHPFLEGDLIASGDLPDASEPRPDRQPPALPALVERDLLRQRRTRADDAHVAAQDVDELRQLVDAVLAQETADRRHPRVVLPLENRARLLVLRD